ncbi:uncharacterized protein DS421_5g151820 [Arachis hypogaea]|nr:uncharacterized protein DS421_5g151820 [Arachis hypogaea]
MLKALDPFYPCLLVLRAIGFFCLIFFVSIIFSPLFFSQAFAIHCFFLQESNS